MRILVDEMPKTHYECHFLSNESNYLHCALPENAWQSCYLQRGYSCPYLAKGVAVNELAGKNDGEKEAGEAAEGNLA